MTAQRLAVTLLALLLVVVTGGVSGLVGYSLAPDGFSAAEVEAIRVEAHWKGAYQLCYLLTQGEVGLCLSVMAEGYYQGFHNEEPLGWTWPLPSVPQEETVPSGEGAY